MDVNTFSSRKIKFLLVWLLTFHRVWKRSTVEVFAAAHDTISIRRSLSFDWFIDLRGSNLLTGREKLYWSVM